MSRAVIGLDCSGETFCCGILVDGREQTSIVGLTPRTALRDLPGHVGYLLSSAGLSYKDVDAVGVTVGPGSFTGVRLGVTLAKTMGLVCACPVGAFDTLEVIARGVFEGISHHSGAVAVALDARRGEVYSGVFDQEDGLFSARVATAARKPADFAALLSRQIGLKALIGSGFEAYDELSTGGFPGLILTSRASTAPKPEVICLMTLQAFRNGNLLSTERVIPMYHREAEVQVSGSTS